MIMLGPKTRTAPGVLKELKIANELKKTKFQIIGYKDGLETWAVTMMAGARKKLEFGTTWKDVVGNKPADIFVDG